jgi:hypothetical protein
LKRIRFWGTRGSLPVALTASGVRDKVIQAVRAASGRTFASDDELNAFVDGLGFPISGTYGGHSPCVEIETGGSEYVLCDLGTGVRPFGQKVLARHGSPELTLRVYSHVPRTGTTSWAFLFHAGVHSRQIASGSTAVTKKWKRRSVASKPHRRSPWISGRWLRISNSFAFSRAGNMTLPACRSASCCSGIPAIRTAIASLRTAGPSSTRPIPNTR